MGLECCLSPGSIFIDSFIDTFLNQSIFKGLERTSTQRRNKHERRQCRNPQLPRYAHTPCGHRARGTCPTGAGAVPRYALWSAGALRVGLEDVLAVPVPEETYRTKKDGTIGNVSYQPVAYGDIACALEHLCPQS